LAANKSADPAAKMMISKPPLRHGPPPFALKVNDTLTQSSKRRHVQESQIKTG